MNHEQLLKFAIDQGASDIHLQAGSTPQLRLAGLIRNVEGPAVEAGSLRAFLQGIAPPAIRDDLDGAMRHGRCFSCQVPGLSRFRCSLYSHLGEPGAVLRAIPPTIRTPEELNLPAVIKDIAQAREGVILVAGGAGSGRTTTLAAMLDLANSTFYRKIATVEDPVEYVQPNKKSLVTHMEVGRDTDSTASGIEQALRQDADVILIGELREKPTGRLALEAADSGRLVLAGITASDPMQAIERLAGMAPPAEQRAMMALVASTVEAVIAQRLATTRDGRRLPVIELYRRTPVTARFLLEGRLGDVANMLASRQLGMQRFDQHLIELHRAGLISGTEAMRLASNPETVAVELRAARPAATASQAG